MLHRTSPTIRAAASPALLERGCVNVITLDAIKDEAGARWAKIRDGVCTRLETLLRQKLGPADFFARISDTAYLITMPSTDPEDVNVICLRVACELMTSFLGRCDIGQLNINNVRDGGNETLALEAIPHRHLSSLIDKAGIREMLTEPTNRPAGTDSRSPSPSEATSPDGAVAEFEHPAVDIAHQFIPVWDSRAEAVTTFLCVPKTITMRGSSEQISPANLSVKERLRIELSSFYAGIVHLAKKLAFSERFLLCIPVTFETIGTPVGRMDVASTCRDLPAEYRPYLMFVLTQVPPGVAQSRLADMINYLRPFARGVMATVAPGSRNFTPYQGIGLHAIGFALGETSGRPQDRRDDVMRLAHNARALKIGTFLHNVGDPETLAAAGEAGIQMLSGSLILQPVAEPYAMTRLPRHRVLSRTRIGGDGQLKAFREASR